MKKYLASFLVVTFLSAGFIGSEKSYAQEVPLSQLIELFISLNIIPADKASRARQALAELSASDSCYSVRITQNLALGSTGSDVTNLQTYLARDPSLYPEGLVTGYYGPATKTAVQRFQTRYRIIYSGTGYGTVGENTRAELARCHQVGSAGVAQTPTTRKSVTFMYPVPGTVYPTGERLIISANTTGVTSPSARVRFYITGGLYKTTWHELDETYTSGGVASLTIPQSVVELWGAGVPFKLGAVLEEWEVGSFVRKAETIMANAFMLSSSVEHSTYYTTGTDNASRSLYLKLKEQAKEFGSTYPHAGVDTHDVNGDDYADVFGYLNSERSPLCGSSGCRLSLWVSSGSGSSSRSPVDFDTKQYRTAHGVVMVLSTKTYGYHDLAFLSTSGKFDLWRWDRHRYVFSRTVPTLPDLEDPDDTSGSNNNTNNNNEPPPPPAP